MPSPYQPRQSSRQAHGPSASFCERWIRALAPPLAALSIAACLERPIGTDQPRTTNVLTDELINNSIERIDLLFVIDNSLSMADKQKLLAQAVPDLVKGLVEPSCITRDGANLGRPETGTCPDGSSREFEPVNDIHVGVITSSLGGYGAEADCVDDGSRHAEQRVDLSHLLGTLPRGASAAPLAASSGFLAWTKDSDPATFFDQFKGLVTSTGERGCGWEAPLEAWLRFLVDPYPYAEVVRRPCSATDTQNRCVGPSTDAAGNMYIDAALLRQRKDFLRPDSLLAIVMLSDENDCSFKAHGQTHTLAQSHTTKDGFVPAFRASAACDDPAFGPNSECCHSCGLASPPAGCPTATNAAGEPVGSGCEDGRRYGFDGEDHANLRCFQQKRRFGVDLLYPTERYSNALSLMSICPYADDLSPDSPACPNGIGVVPNPLFSDLGYDSADPNAVELPPRPKGLVFFAGIVGVPWQDLAVSVDPQQPLVYRKNKSTSDRNQPTLNWNWLIGERYPEDGIPKPEDALMIESTSPRTGLNPATGEALAASDAAFDANSINGHEWESEGQGDLQYACVFPLPELTTCRTSAELQDLGEASADIPNCDCTDYYSSDLGNPLCQNQAGEYGFTQTRAKAYPGLRQLQALHDYGDNSIVASICPKSTDPDALDYGYRPAVSAIVDRLIGELGEKCYPRGLSTRADGSVACIVVEASRPADVTSQGCTAKARQPVSDEVATSVRKKLLSTHFCRDEATCDAMQLCEIEQIRAELDPAGLDSCRNDVAPGGNGWCYVDGTRSIGNPELVANCPSTARRKVRYAGAGKPAPNTITVVSCAGESFDD
jgi:hypothetical protein